jgi:hypothetical protein
LVADAAASGVWDDAGTAADLGTGAEGAADAIAEFSWDAAIGVFFLTGFLAGGATGTG